jgi:hypothetical protein
VGNEKKSNEIFVKFEIAVFMKFAGLECAGWGRAERFDQPFQSKTD